MSELDDQSDKERMERVDIESAPTRVENSAGLKILRGRLPTDLDFRHPSRLISLLPLEHTRDLFQVFQLVNM